MLTLTGRRIVAGVFIVSFLITAPILMLMTAGYDYNFKKSVIQKTGSFSIKPIPTDTTIRFDGEIQNGFRPDNTLRVTDLLSGSYTVRLEKNGYYPWEKELRVDESVNVFVDEVVLFRQATPQPLVSTEILDWRATPTTAGYLTTVDDQLTLNVFNLTTGQSQAIAVVADDSRIIGWSANGSKLLTADRERGAVWYDMNTRGTAIPVNVIVGQSLTNVSWAIDIDYHLFGWHGRDLYQINTITKEYRQLYHLPVGWQPLGPVVVKGNQFFTVATDQGRGTTQVISGDLKDLGQPLQRLLAIAPADDYHFQTTPIDDVVLISRQAMTAYVFDNQLAKLKKTLAVDHYDWPAADRLLTTNGFAVQTMANLDDESIVITRLSQPITAAAFIPRIDYVAYTTATTLTISELDGRDQRNSIDIIRADRLDHFTFSPDGKTLYVAGVINSQAGLFTLGIQ